MRTLFHLVRHGAYALVDHALGGREPHTLSGEGRAQARRVAAILGTRAINAVVSSPVQRARQTAAPIGEQCGLTVRLDPAFEEIDFGDWTGAQFDALHGDAAWRQWNVFRSTACAPGGEAMLAVQSRAVAGLRRLAAAFPDGEVVVVSHGDVIKAMLSHFLGAPLDLMGRLEVEPGSTSEVVLYDEDARILSVNRLP